MIAHQQTLLTTNACMVLGAARSANQTTLAALRAQHQISQKKCGRWSQQALTEGTVEPLDASERDRWALREKPNGAGFRNGAIYPFLATKFADIGFTFSFSDGVVTTDNYPTIDGEVPTLAELVLYPRHLFDGCINREEQRRLRSQRRKEREDSKERRSKERYPFC